MKIRLLMTGRSYHQAADLPDELELADGATVGDALEAIGRLLPEDAGLPSSCLIAVAGKHVGSCAAFADEPLVEGSELTLIAPVAGG